MFASPSWLLPQMCIFETYFIQIFICCFHRISLGILVSYESSLFLKAFGIILCISPRSFFKKKQCMFGQSPNSVWILQRAHYFTTYKLNENKQHISNFFSTRSRYGLVRFSWNAGWNTLVKITFEKWVFVMFVVVSFDFLMRRFYLCLF